MNKSQQMQKVQATEVANTTGDKAACYHLARHFENDGDVNSAVHFFTKAHAYSSAIRLAKVFFF